MRYVRVPVLAQIFDAYIVFVRGTPLLVVLFICYFGLPALLGYQTSAYSAAIVGFILFIAAYLAEDIRTGLRSVRASLVQAALALGFTRAQVIRFVVVPIALRNVIPTLFNQYVRLFKLLETHLAHFLTVPATIHRERRGPRWRRPQRARQSRCSARWRLERRR